MLKLRLLTAIILIPLVMLAIFRMPQPAFALITAVVFGLAAWEWAGLAGWQKKWPRLLYAFIMLMALGGSVLLPPAAIITLGACGWLGILGWLLYLRKQSHVPVLPGWSVAAIGFFVLLPGWQALVILHLEPKLLFYMLLMIWITDTAAYFGGRALGRHKLAPAISPNKTLEGLQAGIVATLILSIVLVRFVFVPGQFNLIWILPVLPLIIAAVAGDLFESALKRMRGIKDSSRLLPGHGGILDRIDSLLAAAPVFACAWISMQALAIYLK